MIMFEFNRFIIHFNDGKVLSFDRKGIVCIYDDHIEVKVKLSPFTFDRTFISKSDIRYFELFELIEELED